MLRSLILAGAVLATAGLGCSSFSIGTGGTPSGPQTQPPPPPGRTLLLTNLDDPPSVKARYADWDVEPAFIVGNTHIDTKHTGRWSDQAKTRQWLRRVPEDYSGYICIDWEAGVFEVIRKGPTHPEHATVMSEMVRLMEFIKKRRPNAKVGYYGLPFKEYWNQNEAWRASMRACKPIFEASDALFPSVYDFYGTEPGRDHQKFAEVTRFALELADGRDVLLYVTHRWHNSTADFGFKLIPDAEFVAHVRHLMGVEYKGRRPKGVVAWTGDSWYYSAMQRRKPNGEYLHTDDAWDRRRAAFAREMQPGESIESYLARLHTRIYKNLSEALGR